MSENDTPSELTPGQKRAISELLVSGNVSKAAEVAGVGRVTVHRWMRQPAFREALRQAEADALDSLQRRLVTLGNGAADALQAGLDSPDLRIRLRAADTVLDRLLALRQLIDFDTRLAALEQATAHTQTP